MSRSGLKSSRITGYRGWFLTLGELIEIVAPPLHHLASLREPFRRIAGGSDLTLFGMGQWPFDPVAIGPTSFNSVDAVVGIVAMVRHALLQV